MDKDKPSAYRRKWTEEEIARLRELYGKVRVKHLARLLGRTEYGVIEQARSRRLGLISTGKNGFMAETKVQYAYNRSFFAVLNDQSAYWAGFLAADGCVHPGRKSVQVILKADDRGHLNRFARTLGYTGPITDFETTNEFAPEGTMLSRLTLCHAQEMIDDLRRHFNITRRKSLTLEPPDLPIPLASHFLR